MPTEVEHVEQARRNARLLAAMQGGDLLAQHPDWVITVAFYTALHLVEAKLARDNMHCVGHEERRPKVSLHLQAIRGRYELLYTESRAARYECQPVKPERAQHLLQTVYRPVREHLCGLLGTSL